MGGRIEKGLVFLDLGKPGFQEEGIYRGFVGGHAALPTI